MGEPGHAASTYQVFVTYIKLTSIKLFCSSLMINQAKCIIIVYMGVSYGCIMVYNIFKILVDKFDKMWQKVNRQFVLQSLH